MSNRKAMNRNWCNQKANPALKTKTGNESIILSPFLKGFPFQFSKNASHTPSFIKIISGHKPCRTILNLFQFYLKLIRMGVPDRASILKDWTHHTFISCFLHILGAGEKRSPQNTKCSIGFSANIADMRIPFQIICNCYTKVFDIIHIFENCTF